MSWFVCLFSPSRYKMISEFTWPNHDLPSDKEAVKKLVEYCGFQDDVAYGKTKIFIRTPRTLFTLEELRAQMLVRIVLFLQKVILHFYMRIRLWFYVLKNELNAFFDSRNVHSDVFFFASMHILEYFLLPLHMENLPVWVHFF